MRETLTPFEKLRRRQRWDDQFGIVHCAPVHGTDTLACRNRDQKLYLIRVKFRPVTCLHCIALEHHEPTPPSSFPTR